MSAGGKTGFNKMPSLLSVNRLNRRIDEIEADVNNMKVPASCGDQFYVLRAHINFSRKRLQDMKPHG